MTNVILLLPLSQKASNLYCLDLYLVRNSQISEVNFLKSEESFVSLDFQILKSIFSLYFESRLSKNSFAGSRKLTSYLIIIPFQQRY